MRQIILRLASFVAFGIGVLVIFASPVGGRIGRGEPLQGVIGTLVNETSGGGELNKDELLALSVLLLLAGHETTTSLIGNGMLALLRQPDEMSRLSNQPSLIDSALEELLRCESPIQLTSRRATESFSLGEKQIQAGDLLVLSFGAANRDPEHFEEPDRLDIVRHDNRHIAFGLGNHYCLGASLARVEGALAFNKLLERFPRIRLAEDAPIKRRKVLVVRAIESLPVTLA